MHAAHCIADSVCGADPRVLFFFLPGGMRGVDPFTNASQGIGVLSLVPSFFTLSLFSVLQTPVYFAVEDEVVSKMVADVRRAEDEGRAASPTTGG